ncbi:MAG: valine--tRNA ligase [Oscillospiraceae bacterium]
MKELEKTYDPKLVEDKIYAQWLEGGYFHTERDANKTPYTIVMPPPNITGQLHLGHAMDNTWQDILIRFKRMQGYAALWVPGTDHASIATEAKIVNAMKAEGLTKADLGRDKFLERAWQWKDEYGGRIVQQFKKLGSSCDWQRERFTLDDGCSDAVLEVFTRLYDKGLIYRGERIINWCPHCKTSISDAEVEYEEQDGFFWHLKYQITGTNEFVELATTRPETMLGDTAIAVHPDDERYKHLHGKTVILPLVNKEIPVVTDTYVDMAFGTGVVKITPAHDPNDFEVGQRHNLPIIKVLTDDAHITAEWGKYAGLDRYEARRIIVEDLKAGGYLAKIEPHMHNVGTCYRCGTTIEPMASLQWFVKMIPLAKPAIDAVRNGDIKFVPERFDKTYYNWMENTRDWCISRQLWWGHRIPAYYCDACGEVHVSAKPITVCPKCGGAVRRDEDTLDTWFSSALWPFSTLGWPNEDSEDYKYFYPNSTLVTGYDIITFWVSRMIFSGLEYTGKAPFNTVLIHGLVRDAEGRKMSKSLGNGIDPLEIIDKYGADALRLTLVLGSTPGNDTRFSDEKVLASRNFANKLWNATRFVMMNLPEDFVPSMPKSLDLSDKWVLSNFNNLVKNVTENLDKCELGIAAQKVQDFIWDIYCDWYIEIAKLSLYGEDAAKADNVRQVLVFVLVGALKLLHPFMPFITEEIYDALPGSGKTIMTQEWPCYTEHLAFSAEEEDFQKVMDLIKAVRNIRAEMNVHPTKRNSLIIETADAAPFQKGESYLSKFAFATDITFTNAYTGDAAGMVQVVTHACRAFIPMMELIDKEKELARLNKELAICDKDIAMLSAKLNNAGFLAKAPENVVEEIRVKCAAAQDKRGKINESLQALNG